MIRSINARTALSERAEKDKKNLEEKKRRDVLSNQNKNIVNDGDSRPSQEEMLVEAVTETEQLNRRWLLARKREQNARDQSIGPPKGNIHYVERYNSR